MVWVQVGTQTGRSNIGGYWAVSQYTVQYPGILDGIPGYRTVSQDTGRYPDTVWYPDTGWYPDTVRYPDIRFRRYPDAAVAWRTDTDIRNRTGYPVFADTVESSTCNSHVFRPRWCKLGYVDPRWGP